MAEEHPPAAAMASYRRSRLPFARPQTLQTLQKPAQLRKEKVPQQAQHAPLLATPNAAGKSHHKATAMAQEHPTAAAMAIRASYRRSRLPFARTQKPPQGHSNGIETIFSFMWRLVWWGVCNTRSVTKTAKNGWSEA